MTKFKKLFLILPVIIFSLYSCSSDDSTSATVTLEGKWQYTRIGTFTDNQEILMDYQHTPGCSKDYIEILPGGIIKNHEFNNPNCQETISTGTWTRSNNSITVRYPDQPAIPGEILELTSTTLKTKFIQPDITDIEILTRIP
ncbi:hypothetical protein ABH942_001533 [Flavobacterium sp. 28YEA47A]|uniref:lipocalin family protein n=1 Tax=Flavobacterium sp. 28YEA47A TaxID=3156276 RepID=UPI0035111650